jgi:hypothetical protein
MVLGVLSDLSGVFAASFRRLWFIEFSGITEILINSGSLRQHFD